MAQRHRGAANQVPIVNKWDWLRTHCDKLRCLLPVARRLCQVGNHRAQTAAGHASHQFRFDLFPGGLGEPVAPSGGLCLALVERRKGVERPIVSGQVFQRHRSGLCHERIAVVQRGEQRRNRLASSASGQRDGRRHADFAPRSGQPLGQSGRGRLVAENGQSLGGGNVLTPIALTQLGDRRGDFVRFDGRRRVLRFAVAIDARDLAEPVELQFHQSGHGRVVAAEPQRLAFAGQTQRIGLQGQRHRTVDQRRRLAFMMAADTASLFAGPDVDPRHLVQFGTSFRVDGLQSDGRVGRHLDGKRAVRGQRHGAQFPHVAAGMDDVRVGRTDGQAAAGQHADGADVGPAGGRFLGIANVLTEQDAGGRGIAVPRRIDLLDQLRRSGTRAEEHGGMQGARRGLVHHRQRGRLAVRVQHGDLLVAQILNRPGLVALDDLFRNMDGRGTQQPAIGQRGHVASRDRVVSQMRGGHSQAADRDTRRGQVRQAAVGHRGRTAAQVRAQPPPVLGSDVQTEFRVTARAIGAGRVQQRFDFAPVEEVVRADEDDPPVGQNFGLVVEDDRVSQRADLAAVGVHDVQRTRRRSVILFEPADARRREDQPPVGQFDRIDIVERAVGQPLGRTAVGRNAVDVKKRFVVVDHRDQDRAPVEANAGRADRSAACIQQQLRLGVRAGRRELVQLAADLHRRGQIVFGIHPRVAGIENRHVQTVVGRAFAPRRAVQAAIVADEGHGGGPAKIVVRLLFHHRADLAVTRSLLQDVGDRFGDLANGRPAGCCFGGHRHEPPRPVAVLAHDAGSRPTLVVEVRLLPVGHGPRLALPSRIAGQDDLFAVGQFGSELDKQAGGTGQGIHRLDGQHAAAGGYAAGQVPAFRPLPRVVVRIAFAHRLAVHVQHEQIVARDHDLGRFQCRIFRDVDAPAEIADPGPHRAQVGGRPDPLRSVEPRRRLFRRRSRIPGQDAQHRETQQNSFVHRSGSLKRPDDSYLVPFPVRHFRARRSVVQISFLTAGGTGGQEMTFFAAKMKFEGLTSVPTTAHFVLLPRKS